MADDVGECSTLREPTGFEVKVLRAIDRGSNISGDPCVAYVAAARRLERNGYASKGGSWFVTRKGRTWLETSRKQEAPADAE